MVRSTAGGDEYRLDAPPPHSIGQVAQRRWGADQKALDDCGALSDLGSQGHRALAINAESSVTGSWPRNGIRPVRASTSARTLGRWMP
jgi:hypothetical protein